MPYGDGIVVVRDFGGSGPDVLFVHAPGFCAAAWDRVAAALEGKVHAYALDLPGHGGSTASARRPADAWNSILAVARHLDLSPLLVGLGQGTHASLCAAIEDPELFTGVVALGGACARTEESAADDIAFYTSPQFRGSLRDRFYFGRTGTTVAEAELLMDRITAQLARDWRVVGFKGLREELRYSIRAAPDGSGWVNLPHPDTIIRLVSVETGDRLYPDERLYRRIRVPVCIVQLSDGLDAANAQRERALAHTHPLVSVRGLDSGEYPHYTRYQEVAAIVLETCEMAQALEGRPASPPLGTPAGSPRPRII